MPVSTTYTGTGAQFDFAVGFSYTSRGFVEVRVATVLQTLTTDYSFVNDTTIRFVVAPPPVADNVVFKRITSTTPLVDFVSGASILEGDLDTSTQQSLHAAEEAASEAYVDSRIAAAVITPSIVVSAWSQADILAASSDAAALTNLGFTALAQALLLEGSAYSFLNTGLGMPAFNAGTLLSATDEVSWRVALDIPQNIPLHRNLVVNGDFQVWQHGPTFTSAADGAYCADQWITLEDAAGGFWDWSQQTTDLPMGAASAINATETSNNVDFGLWQPIESAKCIPLRNKWVTVSVDYKTDAGDLTLLQLGLVSWDGTADAWGTGDIISNWNTALQAPTGITNATFLTPVLGSDINMTATSSWQTKTCTFLVPAGCNNLGIFLGSADSSHTAGASVSFTKIKVEETAFSGPATPFVGRSNVEEWAECERFFAKTFPAATVPAQNVGSIAGALTSWAQSDTGGNRYFAEWRYPVRMVKTPAVVRYSWNNASTDWADDAGSTFSASVTPTLIDAQRTAIWSISIVGVVEAGGIHLTANARIA